MKKISILLLGLTTSIICSATPDISMSGDTLVITVYGSGDLSSSHFTSAQMRASNVKVITANGYKLSTSDVNDLLGANWNTPPFSMMTDLDLSLVDLANNNSISQLHNSNKLNNGNTLGTLVLPESLTEFPQGALSSSTCTWSTIVFPNATKAQNEGTTVVAAGVFTGCTSIKSLVIGTSVKSIGRNAFDGCSNITSIDLLYGVTKIDANAFYGCTGLERVVLPESLTEIGSNAFEQCVNLGSIRLPNSLKYIRSSAFANCTSLTKIVIPENVELIERGAFQNNPLTDVYVLGTNTKCQNQAFQPTFSTYGYSYKYNKGQGQGETVELTDFNTSTGRYTVFHYPQEAYDKYVNPYIRVIGTNNYGSPYDSWNNKWVFDEDGNKLPVLCDKYFDSFNAMGLQSDYEGWWNFMLTGKLKGTYTDYRLLDGKWYSVCFPFDLSAVQIGDAFGNATEVCEFSRVRVLQGDDGKDYIRLEFKQPVSEMKAHHPYMIHPGLHNADYNIIVDVAVDTDTDGDQFQKKLQTESVVKTDDNGIIYTFIGNHTEGVYAPKYSYYYYSGNQTDKWPNAFYKAMRTDVVFTPHTAIVTLNKDNGTSGAKAVSLFMGTEENSFTQGIATAIQTINNQPATVSSADQVYDLTGRRQSAGLNGLSRGIYIINGKKYIVK